MNFKVIILSLVCCEPIFATDFAVSRLDLSGMTSGFEVPKKDLSASGKKLSIGGQPFDHGIGTHAESTLKLALDGKASQFTARVGVDDFANPQFASIEFKIIGDGKTLWSSGVMKGGDKAKDCKVDLAGIQRFEMTVTDAGDGKNSDHADWIEPVIVSTAESLMPGEPPAPEIPGSPANEALVTQAKGNRVNLIYDGLPLIDLPTGSRIESKSSTGRNGSLSQTLEITLPSGNAPVRVHGGPQAIAAETRGPAQQKLPLIRTAHGPSTNLRNNAIYDRTGDWMIETPPGTRITPAATHDGTNAFDLGFSGPRVTLQFRPRYYQKHRGITWYQPWTYNVRRDSISGWSHWWAFQRNFNHQNLEELLTVWKDKRFADYGYRFIQIDDAFQGAHDNARNNSPSSNGYHGGYPDTWLDWRADRFPAGLTGFVRSVSDAGFRPGIWIGSHFSDIDFANAHPDWFICDVAGKPATGSWIAYGVNPLNKEAADTIIRPIYRGLRDAGIPYVKIDLLRHMLYDLYHRHPAWFEKRGVTPAEVFRAYLRIAREELGADTFLLSCWGVLPESVGIADACRIGGDGYGPVTLQQYNSWNGLVWINDPDHCDVLPKHAGVGAGNITNTTAVKAVKNETLIRPALASIAGSMLILSDAPGVYRDDANLAGIRKASPVISSVPGQLYDFDPRKSDIAAVQPRSAITSGANPSPIDGDQFGAVCPYWLNEFDTGFDHWSVLHQLNWGKEKRPAGRVEFADLGLDPAKEYLVHEFWSNHTLGVLRGGFDLPEMEPMGIQSYAIREKLDCPQLVTTSRHLSQGAAEIEQLHWDSSTLTLEGRSRVIAVDPYTLTFHVPENFVAGSATVDFKPAPLAADGTLVTLTITSPQTASLAWAVRFKRR